MKLANATKVHRKFGKPNFLPRCTATQPRLRFSVGENRMKLANATKVHTGNSASRGTCGAPFGRNRSQPEN